MSDKTNDDIFIEEFSNMMAYRRNSGGASAQRYQLPNIPVMSFPNLIQTNKLTYYARVKGLTEPYFDALNNSMVEVLKDRTYAQKQVLSTGKYRKDVDGQYVTKDVSIDADFIIVKSPINIKLSNYARNEDGTIKLNSKGEKIRYYAESGYTYLDMVKEDDGTIKYLYTIPKENIVKATMTALVLSIHKRQNCYYGWRVAFTNGVYMYLSVINFVRTQCDNATRVLGISDKFDYTEEINSLFGLWKANGITFDNQITDVSYRVMHNNTPENLGYFYFKGNLSEEDYQTVQDNESDNYDVDEDTITEESYSE